MTRRKYIFSDYPDVTTEYCSKGLAIRDLLWDIRKYAGIEMRYRNKTPVGTTLHYLQFRSDEDSGWESANCSYDDIDLLHERVKNWMGLARCICSAVIDRELKAARYADELMEWAND